MPSQLHAAAELYFIYQHERMKVFQVVDVLLRLFRLGKMRIQRGPGARGLYLLEKWKPLRYRARPHDRLSPRVQLRHGQPPGRRGRQPQLPPPAGRLHGGAGAVLPRPDDRRGDPRRPADRAAAVRQHRHRAAHRPRPALCARPRDLRQHLRARDGDRPLPEDGAQLLDAPDIKKAFDANTKWDVVEIVSNRYLGGVAELSQRAKMAESGRRMLQFVADNDFKTAIDPILFQTEVRPMGAHAEAWIAAYRMTREGRGFPGVTPALQSVLGGVGATPAGHMLRRWIWPDGHGRTRQ